MIFLKKIIKSWCPPILLSWIKNYKNRSIVFLGDFPTWEDAKRYSSGYDTEDILNQVLNATIKVKDGEAAFERDSVVFDNIEYSWPLLTALLWAAARNKGRLNVLDFGGALGSSFFQNRKFLESLPDVRWNVVEQLHFVSAGQKFIQNDQLHFYKSIGDCLLENQPNFILVSSVLQYLEFPFDVINQLNTIDAICLYIDRTPFSVVGEDKLVIQSVPASIYSASYPMWIFSQSKFEQRLAANWINVACNISPEGCVRTSNGTEFSFMGFLLESRK